MSFRTFQNEKTPFQAIKTRSLKGRKIAIFPKGLTHGFGPKRPFIGLLFFRQNRQENVIYDILERKNTFPSYKNKKFKKSKICHFFKGVNPRFLDKNGLFDKLFFFFSKIGRENVFGDILERKNAFLGYKKKSSKSQKIAIFPKGLTNGFGTKMAIFSIFFFRQYRQGKCVLQYSRTIKRLSRL